MMVYEDVASSIEPGQRCQMRETLSTAISGLRPHREAGLQFLMVVLMVVHV
ncbi:hypothetical protein QFZ76_001493 [Streptomyces sp. V4I2]|nr:hypothetical protein [Streptomyces sp. V4I2]